MIWKKIFREQNIPQKFISLLICFSIKVQLRTGHVIENLSGRFGNPEIAYKVLMTDSDFENEDVTRMGKQQPMIGLKMIME